MIKLRKILGLVGALALLTSLASATTFTQYISSTSYYSGWLTVPSAGNGAQWAAAYTGMTICNGPQGNFTMYAGGSDYYINKGGPVAPGSYNILLYTSGSGYSGVVVTW